MATAVGAALAVSGTVVIHTALLCACAKLTRGHAGTEARFAGRVSTLADVATVGVLDPTELAVHEAHHRLAG